MLQCAVLSRPIILPHVENDPCDKFDLYQVYLHHIHVPCITAVLSYYATERAVNSQTSWRQRLVETHSFAVS